MPNILITGAASGLGKSFVEAFAQDPAKVIYATDKSFPSEDPRHVFDLSRGNSSLNEGSTVNVKLFTIDVTDPVHVDRLSDIHFEIVIHCAGVRGLNPDCSIEEHADVAKAESLDTAESSVMLDTFEINAIGTFRILRAVVPSMKANHIHGEMRNRTMPKVVVMGSRMGSIAHNMTGGGYAYRASKAAVNAIVKSFSLDVPEAIFVVVHPGRVETGLVPVKETGAISPEEVVDKLIPLIDGLGTGDSGRFMDRFGTDIPW